MRDVTDNVTGELPGVEHKRGRGRPRKAHAMTNAERQAAFRARRKALQPVDAKSVTKRMTVTEMLSDVDAYDDCRVEVDALREELARLRAAYEVMRGDLVAANDRAEARRLELVDLQERLDRAVRLHQQATRWGQGLERELETVKAQKVVTLGNGKRVSDQDWATLLGVVAQMLTPKRRAGLAQSAAFDQAMEPFYNASLYRGLLKGKIFPE